MRAVTCALVLKELANTQILNSIVRIIVGKIITVCVVGRSALRKACRSDILNFRLKGSSWCRPKGQRLGIEVDAQQIGSSAKYVIRKQMSPSFKKSFFIIAALCKSLTNHHVR